MLAYVKKRLNRLLQVDFIRFCIVGGSGFVINYVLLSLLHGSLGITVFVSQLIAGELALLSNFLLHHHWTYKRHYVIKSIRKLLVQFHVVSWPAIVGSSVLVTLGERLLRVGDMLALVISSAIVLGWNFGWSKYVVWRDMHHLEKPERSEPNISE